MQKQRLARKPVVVAASTGLSPAKQAELTLLLYSVRTHLRASEAHLKDARLAGEYLGRVIAGLK